MVPKRPPIPAAGANGYPQYVSILLELYKENTAHGRHLETQRQLVSGFVLTVGAAVLGALASSKFDKSACRPLGAILLAFGLMGTFFSIVQYGKWRASRSRWSALRRRLDLISPPAGIEWSLYLSRRSIRRHQPAWSFAGELPLHWLWTLMNFSVLLLGIILIMRPDFICKSVQSDGARSVVNALQIQQTELPAPICRNPTP